LTVLCSARLSGSGQMAMRHKPVAIVVAMRRELAPLLHGRQPSTTGAIEVFELETAVIAVGGIGREAARRAAGILLEKYSPAAMVSVGIAGALTAGLKVGDIVHARDVVDADSSERWAAGGEDGTIVTVSSVSGESEKRNLAQRWRADVVDMEASAVAQIAKANGIEFAAVKAISDELEFTMPPVGRFVNDAGKLRTVRFVAYLASHPKWWGAVRRLDRNSREAAVKLSEALRHLIDQWSQIDLKQSKVEAR